MRYDVAVHQGRADGDAMTPQPIQRSRKPGATHPTGTLFVTRGRGQTAKDFGNPYKVIPWIDGYRVYRNGVKLGENYQTKSDAIKFALREYRFYLLRLRKDDPATFDAMMARVCAAPYIACFCPVTDPDDHCHRSVLIELAAEWEAARPGAEPEGGLLS